jgi:diaminohydroxyphosphoribosylaminopyrimidine deaminase/5-amino-6-(5-phosphoribosylamino)uracil reductase
MARALQLARRGLYTTDPNPRVGSVIVRNGQVIGEGWHERVGEPHAEINALHAAGSEARDSTVYLTLEPCCHHGRTPPCSQALIRAGIRRLVAAMPDPNPLVAGKGFAELEAQGIVVHAGLMEQEAAALNPGFIQRMRNGRPYVRLKLAASLDGRTALAGGESRWITSPAARADVQRWRARSSAIVTGIGTVLADDPSLTVRDFEIGRQPLRVVLDSQLKMPVTARLLGLPGATLIVTASDDSVKRDALRGKGAEVTVLPGGQDGIELGGVLAHLAGREMNELFVECGATLAGGMLGGGHVDELLLYYAPHLMGSGERGMFHWPPLAKMADRFSLSILDSRAVGPDWRIIAKPKRGD